ncbi:MFS transporter [Aureimonas sp. SA4125]|nr:MFS transporter [Aureimonas sp. SA4125]
MILDRYGALALALCSLVGLALGLFLIGQYSESLETYIGFSILLALLGSGATGLCFSKLILAVCERRRGIALGIVMTGAGFGALIIPPAVMPIIQEQGWRSAYQWLSLFPLGVAVFLAFVLLPIRRHLVARKHIGGPDPEIPKGRHLPSVWRSRLFWEICGLFLLLAIPSAGLVVHFVPILIDTGETALQAANTAGLIGLAAIAGRLLIGYLLDRVPVDHLAIVVITVALLSSLVMFVDAGSFGIAAALMLGFVMGAEADLLPFYALRYFPEDRYGTVLGGICGMFLLGCALGPALVGYSYDLAQGYDMPLLVIMIGFLLSLIVAVRLKTIARTKGDFDFRVQPNR